MVEIKLMPWTTRWCFPLQCRVTSSIWCEYGLSRVLSSITSTPSSARINRFASSYNASVWWGCLSNNRLTESWAIDTGSSGKHRDASVHEHAWYVEMRKFTKLLLVHFGGFMLVRSQFRVCITLQLELLTLWSFGRNQVRKSYIHQKITSETDFFPIYR